MAPTRQFEHEAQVSSSDDEDEEASSEENEEQEESDSEEDDKTSPPTLPKDKKPSAAAKKSETTKTPATQPQPSSDDDSDSGSDSDDDTGDLVVRARKADPNVKPIASKPMEEPPKAAKKPRSKPSASGSGSGLTTPVKSTTGSKRASETEKSRDAKDSKKAKKNSSVPENGVGVKVAEDDTPKKISDDSKKLLFQRLWTEEDEIAVLKGMVEYMEKKGADPVADMNAFHEFMKDKLHIDFSKTQLSDKVRRLKKKFENNASKGKNGEDRTFPKAHDQKAYELSKKVWGVQANSVGFDSPKVNGKSKNTRNKRIGKALDLTPKMDMVLSPEKDKEVTKMEVEHNHSVTVPPSTRFFRSIGGSSLGEEMVRDGIELIKGAKRAELDEKWNQLRLEEIELYLRRSDLIREQTRLVLEALRSSGD